MNTRDLLLTLLRYAIVGTEISDDAIKALESGNVATLFKVAKAHDMAHLVSYAIEKCGASLSEEDSALFSKEMESAILRYEMIRADLDDICACFDSEEIDYIPLKGAVLRELYPQAWMRTSCDIDVLVRESEIDRAALALVNRLGYKTDFKKTYHDISLFSPFGMHLELHYNIKENTEGYDKLLTRAWDFSQRSTENKRRYLQSKEFLMLHLMCHMSYHFVGGGCGLRSVLDAWLLEKNTELDMALLESFLSEAGLLKFYQSIIRLGEYWFGAKDVSDELLSDMELYILLGGVYGTKKQGTVSKQIKKGGKLRYLLSRIFVPYKELSVLYPVIKKHKILTPFYQVIRWFGVIFKAKRIRTELCYVAESDSNSVERAKRLLNELEL